MYQKRFGLHRKPFQSVQTDFDFFPSATYQELLPAVLNALRSDLGVAVLTGPAGVGKTVTLDSFRRALSPDLQTMVIRGGTVRSSEELLYSLHRQLLKAEDGDENSQSSSTVRRWDVLERLQRRIEFWGPMAILLDDVHLVEPQVFAELRALLEEEKAGQKLIRLLIVGPLVLEEVLAEPSMTDFAQKIRAHVFLQPLRSTESVSYLAHHIKNAGSELDQLFTTSAIEKIVQASDGIPRCLNLLADETLMVCEETDKSQVTVEIVKQAFNRLQHLPVAWNDSGDVEDDCDHDSFEEDFSPRQEDSSVEIGGSLSESATGGVVEFGGSVEETAPSPPASSSFESISPGVVEFGAPNTTEESALTADTPTDEVEFEACNDIRQDVDIIDHVSGLADTIEAATTLESVLDAALGEETSCDDFMGAIEIGGATNGPLDHSKAGAETSYDADFGEPGDSAEAGLDNLEHHLLLADASIAHDDCVPPEVAESYCDLSTDVESFDDSTNNLENYTRWQPAGEWPAGQALEIEQPVAIDLPASKTTTNEHRIGEASPVFDRYTWAERGRTLSPELPPEPSIDAAATVIPEWPPSVDGVGPFEPIAVIEADDVYPELQSDSDTLVTDKEEANVPETSPLISSDDDVAVEFVVGESLTLPEIKWTELPESDSSNDAAVTEVHEQILADTSMMGTGDLAPWIDEFADGANDDVAANEEACEIVEADSAAGLQIAGPIDAHPFLIDRPADMEQGTTRNIDQTQRLSPDGGTEQAPSVSNGTEEAKTDSSDSLHDTTDVAALIANAVERFIGKPESPTSKIPGTPGSDSTLVMEIVEEAVAENETEKENFEQYAPRLLQEARSRVVSVLSAQGELRQAAGAETVSLTDGESLDVNRPHLKISEHFDSEADGDISDVPNTDEPAKVTGFQDLFTRLRNRGKRPA